MGAILDRLRGGKGRDVAPAFTVKGMTGETFSLDATRGAKRTLLVFYPQDMTPGCTNQLGAIRDTIQEFRALDTEPYGVNEGSPESHARFVDELMLNFDLLVDENLDVARAYGALKPDVERIDRTVVIVGKDGTILFQEKGDPPPDQLLRVLASADDA